MEFGIGLSNYPGCWDDVAFAEQHGFSTAGFFDTPLISGDPFVSLAMAAARTSTIKLGTLLNIPSMRSAPVTATAIASINHLAPGRVFFATGTGYTGRATFGLKPMAVSQVVDHIQEVRGLLAGLEVRHRHGRQESSIRVANPEYLGNNLENPIPIYLAADGPLALKAAGEHAEGWITTLQNGSEIGTGGAMGNVPEVFAASLATVRASAAASGRSYDDAFTSWTTSMCVLEPGESAVSPRALQQVGPFAMFAFHSYACNPEIKAFLPPAMRDRVEIYEKEVLSRFDVPRDRLYQVVHAGHLDHLLDGEAAVLTEEIVRMMSLTGTPKEIAAQLHQLENAGMKCLTLNIPRPIFREVVLDVEEKIAPLLAPAAVNAGIPETA